MVGNTIIIGVDSATVPNKTGLILSTHNGDVLEITEVWNRKIYPIPVAQIRAWISNSKKSDRILLAIDSPMGWPATFGIALSNHMAGKSLGFAEFPRRLTDKKVWKLLQKTPFDVGSSFIARTAESSLRMINELEGFDLVWNIDFEKDGVIEVYPAATLLSYSKIKIFSPIKYKGNDWQSFRRDELSKFLERLGSFKKDRVIISKGIEADIQKEHDFDAVICCLAARDFLQNNCIQPETIDSNLKKEGWIWFRNPSDLTE